MVENTTPSPGLIGEYGFSALIETQGHRYLFDTGSAGAVLENARILNDSLDRLEAMIISHGHFDHTGGVLQIVERNPGIKIYGHPGIFVQRYVGSGKSKTREIGAGFSAESLELAGAEFCPAMGFQQIGPGVSLTGYIPRTNSFEDAGGDFWKESPEGLIKDMIDDEIALVLEHPDGLVVVSGCSHAGLVNTLDYAMKMTGCKQIQTFIGGTHLMHAGPERMSKTIDALNEIDFKRLAVGHCTGFNAAASLKQVFGARVVKMETGMVLRFQ